MVISGPTDPNSSSAVDGVTAPIGTIYLQQKPDERLWMKTHRAWVEAEFVDAAFYRKNTNEWRRARRRVEIRERRNTRIRGYATNALQTNLEVVASADLEKAPIEYLEGAFCEVEERLINAATRHANARMRKRIKWLGQWAKRLSTELDHRREVTL
jgi:hypothetical protein